MWNSRLVFYLGFWGLSFLTLISCASRKEMPETGAELSMEYARFLRITECDGYDKAEIINPWDTATVLHTYYISNGKEIEGIEKAGKTNIVTLPLQSVMVAPAVICQLLDDFGCLDIVSSVCDAEYIHNEKVKQLISQGKITSLGSATQPDIELLLTTDAEALFVSPFENCNYGQMEKLGLSIIECADYMETSPLARLEWIKFYGRLVGKKEMADSIYKARSQEYLKLKNSKLNARLSKPLSQSEATERTQNSKLTVDQPTGNTWYIAGANSTMGVMYADAGADYLFKDYPQTGSVALSFETVYERSIDADCWLLKYYSPQNLTLDQLCHTNKAFRTFEAVKRGRVFGINTAASDFFETEPFNPHLLLQDLVWIFHPEQQPSGARFRYIHNII